jgi:hypothetical protein
MNRITPYDPPAIVKSTDDLAELAGRINAEHQQVETALRAGLEHARAAGELLLQAKAQCGHGRWLEWLKANVAFTDRTARRYMTIASRWGELTDKSDTVSDLTCRDALQLLSAPASTSVGEAPADDDRPYPDRFPLLADEVIHIGTHGFRCPFAGICPDIGGEEWTAFKFSIRKSGIIKAIILDENRDVLDGRQRLRAAAELGLPLDAIPFEVDRGLSDDDKIHLYEQMNLLRYHRTPEETAQYLDRVRAEMAAESEA